MGWMLRFGRNGPPKRTPPSCLSTWVGLLQPPELKSLISHLEVFPFLAQLLDASALVSEVLAEVLNSGLPCKGYPVRFQEKPSKENSLVAASIWKAINQADQTNNYHLFFYAFSFASEK